jgi:hypothetical protein
LKKDQFHLALPPTQNLVLAPKPQATTSENLLARQELGYDSKHVDTDLLSAGQKILYIMLIIGGLEIV